MRDCKQIPLSARLAICLFLSFGTYLFLLSPWHSEVENYVYDLHFALRGPLPTPKEVVIVAIDEASFGELGLQWPWPRGLHAKLIDRLFEEGAAAVAFDVLFAENSTEEDDAALARAIDEKQRVVLACDMSRMRDPNLGYTQSTLVYPRAIERFAKERLHVGLDNVELENSYVRCLITRKQGIPALSVAAAQLFLRAQEDATKGRDFLISGLPQRICINFPGPTRSIRTVSYYQALDPGKYLPKDFFANKLVFVGVSSSSEVNPEQALTDHFLVPFSRFGFSQMPGVEIHAGAASTILHRNRIRREENGLLKLTSVALTALLFLLFLGSRLSVGFLLYAISFIGICTLSYLNFSEHHVFSSPVGLLFGLSLSYGLSPFAHYFAMRKQKVFIQNAFSTYLSPKLVRELVDKPEKLELGGEEVDGSVLFVDLAGFTSSAERLSPEKLIDAVNRYLGAFARIVIAHDGMIDKYIGDCLMAVWGVPLPDAAHALKASRAALQIEETAKRISLEAEESGMCAYSVRIGIASGRMIAGNVGGGRQFNYTVLGDVVNLASRLEGLNKLYDTGIIVDAATAEVLGDLFSLRPLESVCVLGQSTSVNLLELMGEARDRTGEQNELLALFEKARSYYLEQKWSLARDAFSKCLERFPEDGPSREFLRRSELFTKNPPENWDGIFRAESK